MRRAIDEADATAAKLTTIVNHLGEGLVAISDDRRVELANPRLASLLDIADIQSGTVIQYAFPPALVEGFTAWDPSDGVTKVELPLPGGRVGEATLSPIEDAGGAVVLLRDITLSKEIDRMKSDFAATVSHEMRTPLTSVLGFTKLIRGQLVKKVLPAVDPDDRPAAKATERILHNLDVVLEEGARLTALINDVLDLSKMESGQMVWDVQQHEVDRLVQRAFEATDALFPADGPVRAVNQVGDLPPVLVDHDRVLQVLINLIGNAQKFTDAGTVTATATVEDDFVAVSIRDTGIGLHAADQEVVFEKFRQVGDVLTDRPSGTGLGLPICREIVEHLGGRIRVTSTLGQGSTFTFTVPIAHDAQEHP